MTTHPRFSLSLRVLLVGLFLSGSLALQAAEKPNILFVFTDDQAPWTFGFSPIAHLNADTPHMDKLASEGAFLSNSYTITPVCSPSRASLLTSRYGSELGITDWIKPLSRFFQENPEDQPGLDPTLPTFPGTLAKAGYRTGLVGKYHLGEGPEHHPTKMGYDYFMGFLEGGTTPIDPKLEKDGEYQPFEGLTMDVLTDHALEFLEENAEAPFLLSLHYRAPHTRWLPVAPEDMEPFEDIDPVVPHPDYPGTDIERVKKMIPEYLASTRGVDRNLGRVLAKLEELEIADNTVVVFSSDHGYSMGHNGIWHKGNGHWVLKKEAMPPATETIPSGQRPNLYDNSILVPTIVKWPGVTEAGSTIAQTVTNLDWYPTFADMAGAELPEDAIIRGRSIVPLLKGEAPEDWDNELFAQYSTKHQSQTHMRGLRTERYKLIRDFLNEGRDEFYDLKNDPEEKTNLMGQLNPEQEQIVKEMHVRLLERMAEIGDSVAP